MVMVRGCDDDRINVLLFLLQHLAVIAVLSSLGQRSSARPKILAVYIAQRNNVLFFTAVDAKTSLALGGNKRKIQLVVRRPLVRGANDTRPEHTCTNGCRGHEVTSIQSPAHAWSICLFRDRRAFLIVGLHS